VGLLPYQFVLWSSYAGAEGMLGSSGGTSLTTSGVLRSAEVLRMGVLRFNMQKVRAVVAAGRGRCWPLGWVVAHDLRRELCTVTVERGRAGVSA
jgi:hypothetical protein